MKDAAPSTRIHCRFWKRSYLNLLEDVVPVGERDLCVNADQVFFIVTERLAILRFLYCGAKLWIVQLPPLSLSIDFPSIGSRLGFEQLVILMQFYCEKNDTRYYAHVGKHGKPAIDILELHPMDNLILRGSVFGQMLSFGSAQISACRTSGLCESGPSLGDGVIYEGET